MKPEYKIGECVYFCFGYGDIFNSDKLYTDGQVRAGILVDFEFIEARKSYLYTIAFNNPYHQDAISKIVLGQHMVFPYTEEGKQNALVKLREICEEVE